MTDPNPYANNPYACLDISEDASEKEVKVAAAKAKQQYNPDHFHSEEKPEARTKLYRVRAAQETIVGGSDCDYPPDDELTKSKADYHLTANRTRLSVGEKVLIEALKDEAPLNSGRIRVDDGREVRIDDGNASISFDCPGSKSIKLISDEDGLGVVDQIRLNVVTDERSLGVACSPRSVDVGEPVHVEVRDSRGNLVDDIVVTTDRGHRVPVRRGRTKLSFAQPGTVVIEAKPKNVDDEGRGIEYSSDSTTIEVCESEFDIAIEPTSPTVVTDSTVEFTVWESTGSRLSGATLRSDRGHKATTKQGVARFSFEEPGTVTVTAARPDGESIYHPSETDVTVVPAEQELTIELLCTSPTLGEAVKLVIRDECGTRLGGAEVVVEHTDTGNRETIRTDDNGTCQFTFLNPGTYEIKARYNEPGLTTYIPASHSITFHGDPVQLAVEPDRRVIEPGDSVRVVVRDSSGDRVSGVQIEAGESRTTTDENGIATVSFSSPGLYMIKAMKNADLIKYKSTSTEINVK